MSSTPTQLIAPSRPSNHENLVGAILWLPSVEHIPDHGRYKLKAKACDHPCLVVQDCRATDDDTVRICILASYSQETSYNSLGKAEKFDHIPIHPNKPNERTTPNILYLRPRQNSEMLLRKNSWVNIRRIYRVPVSILRPYENHRSWCRFRLAETSIRALHSVLFPVTEDDTGPISSPMSPDSPFSSDEQLVSPGGTLNPEIVPPQEQVSKEGALAKPETSLPDELESSSKELLQPQPLNASIADSETRDTSFVNEDAQGSIPQRVPFSEKPSPFHLIYPFDGGPSQNKLTRRDDSSSDLPIPERDPLHTLIHLLHDLQRPRSQMQYRTCMSASSRGLSVTFMIMIMILLHTLALALALNTTMSVTVTSTIPVELTTT